MTSFTRRGNDTRDIQEVAIVSVNPAGRWAKGMTRIGTEITIACDYPVGNEIVTPAQGEQWYVDRVNGEWRLSSQIPFNETNSLVEPVEGQTVVGGKGPYVVNGSHTVFMTPVILPSYTTAQRPNASELGLGACVYDKTLSKPVFSNGTVWKDAMGTTV